METALIIAQLLLKYGPGVALAVAKIFEKPAPTLADWEAVFALAETPYGLTPQVIPQPSPPTPPNL